MRSAIAVAAFVCLAVGAPAAIAGQADLILLGGKIITVESQQPTAEAIGLAGSGSAESGPMTKSSVLRDQSRVMRDK